MSPGREEYKPTSIKELLVEIRNNTTLIVDLSYATLILRDRSLAEEVLTLEKNIDGLLNQLQKIIMLAARDIEDAEALQSILTVALATDRVSNAAGEIVYPILKGVEPHPILLEGLKQIDEPFVAVRAATNSILCKKSMSSKSIRMKLGVDIVAVRRGEKWITQPASVDRILPDDIIIARGENVGVERLKEIAAG
ncbi:MAG: TrkA C-terminal domain-containing protein [Candidatus Bathyarchaeia archaeon]